ncbi:hypothetical protein [Hymenobacter psychrophilus]|nr:hypothetical protein [Hymenobacter psychrophilus]
MQIFYYGSKTMAGPIGHFSPALRGQSEIMLLNPTAYTKQINNQFFGSFSSSTEESETTVTTSDGTYINGKKLSTAQLQERRQKEQRQQQAALAEQMRVISTHSQALTEKITQSLNLAAEDGWEVTQMSSFGTDGVVYLLRKAK